MDCRIGWVSLSTFVLCAGCSADGISSPDATASDASFADATSFDSASNEASATNALDAGDSVGDSDILGTLSGSCGEVRAELSKATPSLKVDTLQFVAGERYEKAWLSSDGQRLFDKPNAGGSSGESETMSFEVLHFCEGATLLKTETEVMYGPAPDGGANSITDILVEIDGKKVGVSVTRAYKPQSAGAQTDAEIKSLLEKKLEGITASSARVLAQDKWVKQVLHVFAATQGSVDGIQRVLPTIDAAIRADTVVLVTKTIGGGFIYCNPDPPLGQECP